MTFIFTFLFFAIVAFPMQHWASESFSDTYLDYLALASYIGSIFVATYTVYSGVDFVRANWHSLKLDRLS
jgi:hypothetical protein